MIEHAPAFTRIEIARAVLARRRRKRFGQIPQHRPVGRIIKAKKLLREMNLRQLRAPLRVGLPAASLADSGPIGDNRPR